MVFIVLTTMNAYFVLELAFFCQVTFFQAYETSLLQSSPPGYNFLEDAAFIVPVSSITEYTFVFLCGGLNSFDSKASPGYIIGDSEN